MQYIKAHLLPSTSHGQLFPHYDAEANLLEVSSKITREWPFGLDINGSLILDIDANHVLANFDLLIPKTLWKVQSRVDPPHIRHAGNLVIDAESIRKKSFNLPIEVITNPKLSQVVIFLGPNESDLQAVSLSKQCAVFLKKNFLIGFWLQF